MTACILLAPAIQRNMCKTVGLLNIYKTGSFSSTCWRKRNITLRVYMYWGLVIQFLYSSIPWTFAKEDGGSAWKVIYEGLFHHLTY